MKTSIPVLGLFLYHFIKRILMEGQTKLNRTSLIINVILLLAVALLYFFEFAGDRDDAGRSSTGQPMRVEDRDSAGGQDLSIAFVNSEVLLVKYELVNKLAGQLENESRKKDADLQARQKELESEAAYFQESVQNQSLNEQSAQRIYEQLMAKQQDIYQLQEQYAAELSQKEFDMNVTLLDSVRNYLERMNIENKYDFILNYNASGSILHARNTYDITETVLEGLNREYKAKYGTEQK